MTLDQFESLASGIESAAVVLALFAAGTWAYFRFRAFGEAEKAKADLNALKRSLREQSVVNIDLEASRLACSDDLGRWLLVRVTLKNEGNRLEILAPHAERLEVRRVNRRDSEAPSLGDALSGTLSDSNPLHGHSILPAESISHCFLVPLAENGIYLVSYDAKMSPIEGAKVAREHQEAGHGAGAQFWGSNTYVAVE
ncbi:MAG: hypothetical protein O7H41_10845 [Planctomycetota bacterium]|nr:hypothetical protein [Planctomycetota bacterium]